MLTGAGLTSEAVDHVAQVELEKLAQVCIAATWATSTLGAHPGSVVDAWRTRYGIERKASCQVWAEIKQHLDFAVLGRFVAARPSKLPLRTSTNQALRLFSDRYSEEQFQPLEFEVHIESQGVIQITGFPLSGLPV